MISAIHSDKHYTSNISFKSHKEPDYAAAIFSRNGREALPPPLVNSPIFKEMLRKFKIVVMSRKGLIAGSGAAIAGLAWQCRDFAVKVFETAINGGF